MGKGRGAEKEERKARREGKGKEGEEGSILTMVIWWEEKKREGRKKR